MHFSPRSEGEFEREAQNSVDASEALVELRTAAQARLGLLSHGRPPTTQDGRRLVVLQRLLGLDARELSATMNEAAQQVAEVLAADKVDVFFYDPAEAALIVEASSHTPMVRRQKTLGLDRLPVGDAGLVGRVFETGESARVDNAAEDPDELRSVVESLGVRSSVAAPLEVAGTRRGVLLASSATPAAFTGEDLQFVEAVASWLGLTSARTAHAQFLAAQAAEEEKGEGAHGLTYRQLQVVALIRRGLTNAEIAQQLVLDPGTVANHVANILTRTGFRSRTQIAAWAAERGLDEDRLLV